MPTTVRIPSLAVEGAPVDEVLDNLEAAYPGLKGCVRDGRGSIAHFVSVFVDGEDVRRLDGLTTPVDGADLSIVLADECGPGAGQVGCASSAPPTQATRPTWTRSAMANVREGKRNGTHTTRAQTQRPALPSVRVPERTHVPLRGESAGRQGPIHQTVAASRKGARRRHGDRRPGHRPGLRLQGIHV